MSVARLRTRATAIGPQVLVGIAVLVAGSTAVLVRVSGASSLVLVFYRLLIATVSVTGVAVVFYREDFLALRWRDLATVTVGGATLGFNLVWFFESLNWTSVAAATTLAQMQVVFVTIGAYVLFDEHITVRTVAGIVTALAGVTVLVTGGFGATDVLIGEDPLYGNILASLAGLLLAGYLLTGRSIRQRIHLFPYVTIVYAVAMAIIGVTAVLGGEKIAPTAYPPREWLLFLALGLGPGVVSHTLINWSLKHLDSSTVSVMILATPAVSTLYGVALLSEVPTIMTLFGSIVILIGIYVTTTTTSS